MQIPPLKMQDLERALARVHHARILPGFMPSLAKVMQVGTGEFDKTW